MKLGVGWTSSFGYGLVSSFLQNPEQILPYAPGLTTSQYNLASDIDGPVNVSSRKGNKTMLFWSPPNENELKMNVDAALCTDSGEATAGIVVRNHQGSIVAAASIVLKKCKDVEEAEATAIWET
jgi:hypothetical protein